MAAYVLSRVISRCYTLQPAASIQQDTGSKPLIPGTMSRCPVRAAGTPHQFQLQNSSGRGNSSQMWNTWASAPQDKTLSPALLSLFL
ncbi:hypothetical protein GBF38_017419 [Nibea albiflora]|uniref:Uncharacterized protein n=1 Tax=Nibea albiflora TaxID=240163 RepID=A0ACB7F4P2_NIBAL|nr:hypothetical protein GBF38_017419 [Nibea albiflora]